MGLAYEHRMRLLQWVKPEKKDELLLKISKGETVDITKDADLFYQVNRDRMPIEQQIERDKYKPLAEHVKQIRASIDDPWYGKTRGGKMRYLGEIPAEIYFTHPWFSPMLDKKERDANIKKFFRMFPAFRVGYKDV